MRSLISASLFFLPLVGLAQDTNFGDDPMGFALDFYLEARADSGTLLVWATPEYIDQHSKTFWFPVYNRATRQFDPDEPVSDFTLSGCFDPYTTHVTNATLQYFPVDDQGYPTQVDSADILQLFIGMSALMDASQPNMTENSKKLIVERLRMFRGQGFEGESDEVRVGHRKYWYTMHEKSGVWFGVECVDPDTIRYR